ncbi:hypothetical protein BU15DRAFT_81024 [Melanogaster broomeanus]|nr:hypothetical protein BU15DRAFT_81024 [Melanogaster broomeanus]
MSPLRSRCLRRSAHLQASTQLSLMASPSKKSHSVAGGSGTPQVSQVHSNPTHKKSSHMKGSSAKKTMGNAAPTPGPSPNPPSLSNNAQSKVLQVYWEHVPARTDRLLDYLLKHPADYHVLFHDKHTGTSTSALPSDARPSGRSKKDVQAVIAKYVFKHDAVYGEAYKADPDKFQVCVGNRLGTLKTSYRKYHNRFKQSGEGIDPGDPRYANLLEAVTTEFPYFSDLNSLWHGNPSYDANLVSSAPNKNHAQDFLSAVGKKSRTKGAKSNIAAPLLTINNGEIDEDNQNDAEATNDVGLTSGEAVHGDNEQHVPDVDMGDEGEEYEEDDFNDHHQWEQTSLKAGDDVEMGSVRGQNMSPSPTPPPSRRPARTRSKFSLPQVARTPSGDARASFRNSSPYLRPPTSTSSVGAASSSVSSSGRKSGKLHTPWSNSSETSSTRGASGSAHVARRVKSELLGCISGLNDETESIIASLASGKTAQYQAKIDYAMQDRELDFRREMRDIERADAEVAHIRNQEAKKLDIELLEKEAETLRLKIQLAGLSRSNDLPV